MSDQQDSGFSSVVTDNPGPLKGPALKDPLDDDIIPTKLKIPDTTDKPNLNPKVEMDRADDRGPQVDPVAYQAPRRDEGGVWNETTASTFGGYDPDELRRWTALGHPENASKGWAGEDISGEDTPGVSLPAETIQKYIGPLDDNLRRRMAAHEIRLEVVNPKTGEGRIAPLIDVGPAKWTNKGIDLMKATARQLGVSGSDPVRWRLVSTGESTDGHPHRQRPQTILDELRGYPQYDQYSDGDLLEAYRQKNYPDVAPAEFDRLAKTPGGKDRLDDLKDAKTLTGLQRLRKAFPGASHYSDDQLLEEAYNEWDNPHGETLEAFKERMNPPHGFLAVLGNVAKEAGKGLAQAGIQTPVQPYAFASAGIEADRWLQQQPWYKFLNPVDWLSMRLGQTVNGDTFRDAVRGLREKSVALQQQAQAFQGQPGLGNQVAHGVGEAVGSLPGAAASFALQGYGPAANLIWGMTYEQVSSQAEAIDAKSRHDLLEGVKSGAVRAVQQYLINSPWGRLASGAAQVGLGLTDQAAQAFIEGKPNPLDQWVSSASVNFLLGALLGKRSELPKAAQDEFDHALQLNESGDKAKALEATDRVMGLLDDRQRQAVMGLLEDHVRQFANKGEQSVGVQAQPHRKYEAPAEAPGEPVEQPMPQPGYHGGRTDRAPLAAKPEALAPPVEPERPPEPEAPPEAPQRPTWEEAEFNRIRNAYNNLADPKSKTPARQAQKRLNDLITATQSGLKRRGKSPEEAASIAQGMLNRAIDEFKQAKQGRKQRPNPEEPPKPAPPRRKIRDAYQGIAQATQSVVRNDPEYTAALQEQIDLERSLPEGAKPLARNDAYYQAIRDEYDELHRQFQNPYVPIHELWKRSGLSWEDFQAEMQRMAKEKQLSLSTGEPLFATPEALAHQLELGGEKFLHAKLEPEAEENPGLYFMLGIDPLRALKQFSNIFELWKPLRSAAGWAWQHFPGREGLEEWEQKRRAQFDPEALGPSAERAGAGVARANAQQATQGRMIEQEALRATPEMARMQAEVSPLRNALKALRLDKALFHPDRTSSREMFFNQFTDRQQRQFLIDRERNVAVNNPVVRAIMDFHKKAYDLMAAIENQAGIKFNLQEEYIPHLFENKDEFNKYMAWKAHRYRWAKPGFVQPREFDDLGAALAHGFKLKTSNPERLFQLRLAAHRRAMSKLAAMQGLEMMRDAVKMKQAPQGLTWPEVRSPDGTMYQVSPEAMQVLKNAYDPGKLYDSLAGPMFKFLSAAKGLQVGLELGFSLFHPMHLLHIRMNDALSAMGEKWVNKQLTARDFFKGLTGMAGGLGTDLRRMHDVVDLAQGRVKGPVNPEVVKQLRYVHEAGLDLAHSREREMQWASHIQKVVHAPKVLGPAARGVDYALNLGYRLFSNQDFQRFYFGRVVPAMKAQSLMDRLDLLFRQRPDLLTNDAARLVELRRIGKEIEGRFGELNYDNLFWNKTAKDIGVSMFLSLGWQLGVVRMYGGFIHDFTKNAARMDEIARTFRTQGTRAAAAQAITNRMAMAMLYSGTAGLINGVWTYLATGTPPSGMDYWNARIGKNPDGTDKRLSNMFFTKEYQQAKEHIAEEGVAHGVETMVKNKLNPVVSEMLAVHENANYMGQQIYSNDWEGYDHVLKNVWDIGKHFLGGFAPFSIQNRQPHQTAGDWLDNLLGFGPAPMWTTRSPLENEIVHEFRREHGHVIPREEEDKMEAIHELREAAQAKDEQGVAAARQKLHELGASEQTIRNGIRYADTPVSMKVFKQLRPDAQVRFLNKMPPEEAKQYLKWSSRQARHLYHRQHQALQPE